MQSCSVYDSSMKFSRFTYGALALTAYLIQSSYLVLIVSLMTISGAYSLALNIPYQLHKPFQKKVSEPVEKDTGELRFGCTATGMMLLIGFFLLEFTSYETAAWIYVLMVTAMIFLASLVGFCPATLVYIVLRNSRLNHKKD